MKDPRLTRLDLKGYNQPKRTMKRWRTVEPGETIGEFILKEYGIVGKNKVWVCLCKCGKEKVFWKYSSILSQKSCGCEMDSCGFTAKQRRSILSRMQGYKNGAHSRGFQWDLSYEEFALISTKPCFYCGDQPKVWDCVTNAPSVRKDCPHINPEEYSIKFSGVDRFDSKSGYSVENCVPCCVNCNRSKSNMSFDEFKKHVQKLYKCLFKEIHQI